MEPNYVIDLSGPQGNVYYILGVCINLAAQLELPNWDKQKFLDEIKTKSYSEVLDICKKRFGLAYINNPYDKADK